MGIDAGINRAVSWLGWTVLGNLWFPWLVSDLVSHPSGSIVPVPEATIRIFWGLRSKRKGVPDFALIQTFPLLPPACPLLLSVLILLPYFPPLSRSVCQFHFQLSRKPALGQASCEALRYSERSSQGLFSFCRFLRISAF